MRCCAPPPSRCTRRKPKAATGSGASSPPCRTAPGCAWHLEADLRAALALQQMELREALSLDQFVLHYQPQVESATGRLTGFEALLRWQHPTRGMVGPDDFIPLAETIGVIGALGGWVLRTACQAAARWPVPAHGTPLRVAVNLSPLQLREGRALVAGVKDALAQSGLAPARLEIEVTESAMAEDAAALLAEIHALGVLAGDRRFRHGLFLAQPHRAIPLRPAEGRPVLHPRPRRGAARRRRGRLDDPRHRRARHRARHLDGGGGGGDAGAGGAGMGRRGDGDAGLPGQPPAAGGGAAGPDRPARPHQDTGGGLLGMTDPLYSLAYFSRT